MDPRSQLVKLKQVSRLERESGIPEFCEALVQHIFTVAANAAQARNVLEYTLGAIMTRMPEIEEEDAGENMEEWEAPYSPRAAAPYSPGAATPYSPGAAAHYSPRAAAPYSPRAAAPYSPRAAAPYSPGAGISSFSSRLEPPPVMKGHINRKRLILGNENGNEEGEEGEEGEEEGMIDPEHLASVAWQVAVEQPLYALNEELDAARSSGEVLQLCLKKLTALFDNDIKAKGTMNVGNLLNYTTRSYTSKEELDHILIKVFGLIPLPTPNPQANELLHKYKAGVDAIMASSKGGRRRSRRSRRSRRKSSQSRRSRRRSRRRRRLTSRG
jgi:hypothetical protein